MKNQTPLTALFIKRTFDFLLSFLAIVILLPFFILLTIVVAIAMGGNPFYFQKRIGKNGKIFNLIKYRSMNNKKDKNGNLLPDEKRMTKFGENLRKFSFDELPELLNIIKGDMSIVGPRPMPIVYSLFFSDKENERHNVRPGLTGLAQISGRNFLPWDKRFELDLAYIRDLSLKNDIKIIIKTFQKVFKGSDVAIESNNNNVVSLYDKYFAETETDKLEIGYNFIFDSDKKGNGLRIFHDKRHTVYCNTGRNAIQTVINANSAIKKVYLPAFTCDSVIEPFIKSGLEIKYYSIEKDLTNINGLYQQLIKEKDTCFIYLQSYFASYSTDMIKENIRNYKNAVIIEDITHSLFDEITFRNADYYIGSIRKWCGIGEGAVICCDEELNLDLSDNELVDYYEKIGRLHKSYFENGCAPEMKLQLRKEYDKFNRILENKPIQFISEKAKAIINSLDADYLRNQRRQNYMDMLSLASEFAFIQPIFAKLDKKTVPLYFPFFCGKRDEFKDFAIEHKLYTPIIWPESDYIKNSPYLDKEIYDKILCFPIDQRYGRKNMIRIFEIVKGFSDVS